MKNIGCQSYAILPKKEGYGLDRNEGSCGNGLKRDTTFLEQLEARIKEDPTRSMRRLAIEFKVSEKTICNAVHGNFGLNIFAQVPRHLLTVSLKEKRLNRCQKLVNWLKSNPATVKIFSDKKLFTVDQVCNRRNNSFLAQSTSEVTGVFRTKHPASAMVLGIVGSNSKKMTGISRLKSGKN